MSRHEITQKHIDIVTERFMKSSPGMQKNIVFRLGYQNMQLKEEVKELKEKLEKETEKNAG